MKYHMPYLLFLKKQQNLKLSSAANYRLGFWVNNITGAQLHHNDFRIFADLSRIFTYNCDETFKTTSRNLSENMPGHA